MHKLVARSSSGGSGSHHNSKSVVALLGVGHVPGVTALWQKYGLHKPLAPEQLTGAEEMANVAAADSKHDILKRWDQPQAGVHRQLMQDARALCTQLPSESDFVFGVKKRALERYKRQPPHQNPLWFQQQLAAYPWVTPSAQELEAAKLRHSAGAPPPQK